MRIWLHFSSQVLMPYMDKEASVRPGTGGYS